MNKHICVIPARAGSKRIPGKNKKEFFGKPIIEYSIDAAIKSDCFHEIFVVTDDLEIKDYINRRNIGKSGKHYIWVLNRDENNADDEATLFDLFKECNKTYVFDNQDYVCILYPCAPLVKIESLQKAKDMIKDYNVVFPAIRVCKSNQLLYVNSFGDMIIHGAHDDNLPFDDAYIHAGQFFYCNVSDTLKNESIVKQQEIGYIKLRDYEAQDINTPEDWEIAEVKYRMLKK
jgi:N-acylneuraminate cytidylyltransferase